MYIRIIANIFSLVGSSLLAYSSFSKSKNSMLFIQVGDSIFNAIGSLLIGSYSATITNLMSALRNILIVKKKINNTITVLLVVFLIVFGYSVNNKGFIGLLPIVASIEYTVLSSKLKTAQGLRYALFVNIILWTIHDFIVGLYTSFIIDVILVISTILSILLKGGTNDK